MDGHAPIVEVIVGVSERVIEPTLPMLVRICEWKTHIQILMALGCVINYW
jgi:hypothetical protein